MKENDRLYRKKAIQDEMKDFFFFFLLQSSFDLWLFLRSENLFIQSCFRYQLPYQSG